MKKIFTTLLSLLLSVSIYAQKQVMQDSLIAHFDLFNYQPFEALQLEDTAGNIFNTATLAGKTVYVDFWFTTCPPCIKEIPFFKSLQQRFSPDTNVVFLSICIENFQRKIAWKESVKSYDLPGTHLFYALNRPQQINLLRRYKITFPTYLLLNKDLLVVGYDAPRPSQKGWVEWAIVQTKEGRLLSEAYKEMINQTDAYKVFCRSLQ